MPLVHYGANRSEGARVAASSSEADAGSPPAAPGHPTGRVRVALIPTSMPTNPYPALLAAAVRDAGADVVETGRPGWRWLWHNRRRVDVIHLHWLHVFYRRDDRRWTSVPDAIRFVLWLACARLLGYRLVWTLHNARPHDSPTPAADRIAHLGAMNLAAVVVHCEAARGVLHRRKWLGTVHPIPHGSYIGVYPDTIDGATARRQLGLPADRTVFVAFGLIRGYKGVRRLVETFDALSVDAAFGERATLLIVGRPRTSADRQAIGALRSEVRHGDVRWVLEFVPDDQVQRYMRAADFAVAAFEQVLVSGSAILALSFGVPVIAPRRGCLPELLAGGAGLLYDPPDGLGAALETALRVDRKVLARAARGRAQTLDWQAIGRAHLAVYRGTRA